MKIMSWNVNGLRSCIEKGLTDVIQSLNADVVCLQETKSNRKQVALNIEGYEEYWNSSRKSGYSGVLVLSKLPVISVREGFGNDKFDIEGRLLTIEFEEFYLLNAYFPMSKSRLSRNEYRNEWDDYFFEYIKTLQKPIIICGDFNVAHKYLDIYPESSHNKKNPAGFIEFERDNFDRLLNFGFVDIFRLKNPAEVKYSWWSSRLNKRGENRGWRLDYFLVSNKLLDKVVDTKILTHILGSDHCPITLTIDTTHKISINEDVKKLAHRWDTIDWKLCEQNLFNEQKKLALAIKNRDKTLAYEIQDKILVMFDAKALAVRHVSASNSESGVDGVRFTTSSQKMQAVYDLDERNFLPSPMKSIKIHDGKKERIINIPTYHDRAISVLMKYALEPVAETTADRKSFGFRKGRSPFDACSYIETAMKKTSNLWVLKADIKAYYDTICHKWILDNLPMRNSLKKMLKTGLIVNGELFPSDIGISLGLSLSPTIANMVLDGMQNYVQKNLYKNMQINNFTYGDMVRFADDFIFFAESEQQALEIKNIVVEFLQIRGLKLSEEKTIITKANDGFDFLGWNFMQIGNSVSIVPTELNIAQFERNIEQKIMSHKASTESLIRKINKSIIGYSTYHKHIDNADAFRHLDVVINTLLVKKIKQRHPNRPFSILKTMYWYDDGRGNFLFTHPDKKHLQVMKFKNIPRVFHFAIKTSYNYFFDTEYYKEIEKKRKEDKRTDKNLKIWNAQDGKCYFCGKPMLSDQFTKLIKTYDKNKNAYIHSRCANNIFEYALSDEQVSALNLDEILNFPIDKKLSYYIGISEFFKKENRQVFTLTFEKIEELVGEELEYSTDKNFWYDKHCKSISHSWLNNGYDIQRLNINDKKIVFRKVNHELSALHIPNALTKNKISKNAQDEISAFMKYIVNKYGL